jgi:HK97 family phage portal protein
MAIAESVAMAELSLHLQRGDKAEKINNHVFLDVWTNVNPFMNNFELRELTEIYQLLTGNAYWFLNMNKLGVPAEIWIVPSQYMTVVPDTTKFIKGYIYQAPGEDPVAFDASEIVHFKYPNPNNVFYGLSPLMAAAYAVDTDLYMSQYQASTFKNGGLPAAILTSDQVINKGEADRMRENWRQLYGGAEKAGKVAILSRGLKFQSIALSQKEMDYISSKNTNRDTILGIFRVPKSVLGLVEDVNRANAEASEYVFNLRNIQPKLIRFQQKINEKIMPLYKQSGNNFLYVEFENIVPKNREIEIKDRDSRLASGYSTINEERENDGQKPVDWGSVPIMPLAVAPLGSAPEAEEEAPPAVPEDQTPPPPGEELPPEKTVSKSYYRARAWAIFKGTLDRLISKFGNTMIRLFERQRKEVLRNLNKSGKAFTKADDVDDIIFDVDFWEKEFFSVAGERIDENYVAGIRHGNKLAGTDVDFGLDNPAARKWLKDKKFKFSFETNKTTTDALRTSLNEGLKAGETIKELASRVNTIFDFASDFRSLRIARTESSDAENKGILDVWNEGGVVESKEWLHGGGGDTPRPEHVAMNGEVVAMDETFSNGLLYPGDQINGDASDVCNCTCSMIPLRKKE